MQNSTRYFRSICVGAFIASMIFWYKYGIEKPMVISAFLVSIFHILQIIILFEEGN